MKPELRQAKDKEFVESLTRQNMEPYYQQIGIHWDQALFDKNWEELESYEIILDDDAVGVLRLSHDNTAYYIRDLQVQPGWQNRGVGSQAVSFANGIAREAGVRLLRLCVFSMNPAVALYERLGFRICKTEGAVHYMELELS
ncbi:GNAT family N-acetyltransferase [Halomonas sp. YLGW01]|uniref:GNAT family N-acetyltransferase n=1 Tax=Halomonas sp. YLGW01 TaxID=2773308 RepID=UPI001780102D|nr:GNAT family N-acetyltransferase [Halomonas sp. YLGW01]